jgi:diguanylate cyclase (GGDEF)-like protein
MDNINIDELVNNKDNDIKDIKKSSKKLALKCMWVAYVLISIVICLILTDSLINKDYATVSRHMSLDDDWKIRIKDNVYEDISLKDFSFKAVNKGDTITMERKLPDSFDIKTGALMLYIRQCTVEMYIDDELVYQYGQERLAQKKTLGSGIQFVDFPKDYAGKELRIELEVTENAAFTRFDSMNVYEWGNVYRVLVTENRLPLLIGSFLVVFGLVTALVTMFALLWSRRYISLFSISLFSICVGLWTLCYYKIIMVFAIPMYSAALLEYMSLYLAPLPLIVYMHEQVDKLNNKFMKVLYVIFFIVQLSFDIIVITLHTLNVIHCAAVLREYQVIMLSCLLFFSVVLIKNVKASHTGKKIYQIGMLIIIYCVAYDLIGYYRWRFLGKAASTIKGMSSIGILLFIFILIFMFYMNITEKMMEDTERNLLIKCAYTDELTHMNNRRYCSEYMKKIEDKENYAVICFDLNNLKVVNDTYGHSEGDILIKNAANVITDTFGKYGIVGRMGGDEFIAILDEIQNTEIGDIIKQFDFNISEKNIGSETLNLSIAYGYALSSEMEEKNIEKLYQVADDRMYENKRQYKEQNMYKIP